MTKILALALLIASAQAADAPWMKPDPDALQRWQAMRFGMFIHWGPVSLTGHEIGWSRGKETPIEKYDSLYKEFNPTKFNADEWVSIAKAAGMKYIVLTTKHHDGFCLWDTKQTDYNIMNSPFQRDVVKELSAACRKQGIAFGTYYSVCDWHHPDFPLTSPGGKVKREKSDIVAYRRYLRAQVTELIQNYGPLVTMWFDVPQMFDKDEGAENIRVCRTLQPDILINNRAGGGCGDYDTPEQRIDKFNMERPWESCMTISAHNHWAWGGEKDGVKPLADCLLMLIRCAGGDGNMLLNVGPRPDGLIDPEQANRLKEIGDWLAKYGESIYGTRGGPYKPTRHVATTRKGNTLYVHITAWPEETLVLPALPTKIVKSTVLTGGKADIQQTDERLIIAVPKPDRHAIDTIIALELDRPALEIAPINVGGDSLTAGKKATASNVFKNDPRYGAAKAVDDDDGTRWATDASIGACWLEVDLGAPQTFDRAVIQECVQFGARVKAFELQYKDGNDWKSFYRGNNIGQKLDVKFSPVTARIVRLHITEGKGGPTISEFQLFAPQSR